MTHHMRPSQLCLWTLLVFHQLAAQLRSSGYSVLCQVSVARETLGIFGHPTLSAYQSRELHVGRVECRARLLKQAITVAARPSSLPLVV